MEGEETFDTYIDAGLASLGIDADEIELAVMRAARQTYKSETDALWTADLKRVRPEADQDLSRAPRE